MDSNDQPVRFFMPDGFKEEDLHAPEYSGPLLAAAAPMATHARKLAKDMDEADFDPSTRFDATLNGAFTMIDDFFETLVGYAQGRVPAFAADDLVSATNALVEKQRRSFGGVCAAEINAVGQAFRKSHLLWSRCAPTPRMPRAAYVKRLFKSKDGIVDAICALTCAFAKHQAQKPPPGKGRARKNPKRAFNGTECKYVKVDGNVVSVGNTRFTFSRTVDWTLLNACIDHLNAGRDDFSIPLSSKDYNRLGDGAKAFVKKWLEREKPGRKNGHTTTTGFARFRNEILWR